MHRSPSQLTESGRANAAHDTGSLGIAISEAVEIAAQNEDINYALGSVLNHVLLHQTVIGQECDRADGDGRRGAGRRRSAASAAARTSAASCSRSLRRNLREGATTRFIAAEPAACPTLTKGVYATTSATRRA